MKKLFWGALIIFGAVCLQAQEKVTDKLHVELDYSYNLGLSAKLEGEKYKTGDVDLYGHALHLSVLYDCSPRVTLGVGVGIERYEEFADNTLPVFATLQYRPLHSLRNAYVFTDLGYGVINSSHCSDMSSGWMGDLGVGYRKMWRKHLGWNARVGYDFRQFRGIDNNIWDETQGIMTRGKDFTNYRHSLIFSLGLLF